MIAITGASGNLGQLTLAHLVKKTDPNRIVAIVRDPAKLAAYRDGGVQIRIADYDDSRSLEAAFEGVESLLQISTSISGAQALQQEAQVVQSARAAGVQKITYTSTLTPGPAAVFEAGRTCAATERAIMDSGLDYTFFRNSMYLETIPLFIGNALQDGQIYYPGGNGKVSFASRVDMAEALANVLTDGGHQRAVYQITGEEALSFADIADLLKSVKGLDAAYHDVPAEAFAAELRKAGLPEGDIGFMASMAASIHAGEFSAVDNRLEELLGRKRTRAIDYIHKL